MNQEIVLSGMAGSSLRQTLHNSLRNANPQFVGIAAAFASVVGIQEIAKILQSCGSPKCRLIAGTDNAITHPEALYTAKDLGWNIRLGSASRGIFHPKLLVAGRKVTRDGHIERLCCLYVGSSNLTAGGLYKNVECGLIAHSRDCPESASTAFGTLWKAARPASDAELRNYAARFAECARRRSVLELNELGIGDDRVSSVGPKDLQKKLLPSKPALGADFAVAAWTGLQSFTGEYRFQVEFPKAAGKVISQLLAQHPGGGLVDVYCPDDETTRPMRYKFYADNSMFRLNVPNDAPGVVWARRNKDGLAIVEQGPRGGATLRLRLVRPGSEAREIVTRSAVLGTWGKTTTRSYGWF